MRRLPRVSKDVLKIKWFTAVSGLVLVSWGSLAHGQQAVGAANETCASKNPAFVGPCVTMRARLQHGGDNVVVRIWPVGTKRTLGYLGDGVSPDGRDVHCQLPQAVEEAVVDEDKTVYADVTVRPITQSRPGAMQFVCIAAAKRVVVRDTAG